MQSIAKKNLFYVFGETLNVPNHWISTLTYSPTPARQREQDSRATCAQLACQVRSEAEATCGAGFIPEWGPGKVCPSLPPNFASLHLESDSVLDTVGLYFF